MSEREWAVRSCQINVFECLVQDMSISSKVAFSQIGIIADATIKHNMREDTTTSLLAQSGKSASVTKNLTDMVPKTCSIPYLRSQSWGLSNRTQRAM